MSGLKQKSVLVLIAASAVLLVCFSPRAAAEETLKIMPLGDSITRGYYSSTNNNGYRKPLYINLINGGYNFDFVGSQNDGDFADPNHAGHDGQTASWLNPRMNGPTEYWLSNYQPDVILYHIGTNNLNGLDIATYAQDANETLEIIYGFDSNIIVILAKIILTTDDQARNTRTHNYNLLLGDIAQDWADAGYSIISVDMENALDYLTDMADEIHPNDIGYAKMAEVWYNALDGYLDGGIAPTITSAPVTNGTVQQLYTYDVRAIGYPLPNYTLTTYPSGMTIEPNTGLIEWVPTTTGDFDVTVKASNGLLPDSSQSFTITVSTIIKFDTASETSSSTGGTTLSWWHTIGSGNDRILVVGIVGEDDNADDLAISSITYNGVGMDLVEGSSQSVDSNLMKTELYYLLDSNLPSSSSYMVEVTYSGNVDRRAGGAISLENVKQQGAEAVATSSNIGLNSISTDITTQTDDAWVVDVVGCGDNGSFVTTTTGMMKRFDTSSNDSTAAGSTRSVESVGPTMMSWQHSVSAPSRMAQSVAAFAHATRIISGHILEPNGVPIDDVLVSADHNGGSDTTDANGYYEVSVSYGWSGTVVPTKAEYIFDPAERIYLNVITDRSGQDYEGNTSIYDLDNDGFIGWGDVMIMYQHWLADPNTDPNAIEGDINSDGTVDFLDFAGFTSVW